jgi:hypothetical protein
MSVQESLQYLREVCVACTSTHPERRAECLMCHPAAMLQEIKLIS